MPVKSDGPLHLVRTEASGTSVHMAGSPVHDSLDPLHIGLPLAIGTSVGVRDLNTKGNALTTKITLRHSLHLPSEMITFQIAPIGTLGYHIRFLQKKQALFFRFFQIQKYVDILPSAGIIAAKTKKAERGIGGAAYERNLQHSADYTGKGLQAGSRICLGGL